MYGGHKQHYLNQALILISRHFSYQWANEEHSDSCKAPGICNITTNVQH